MSARLRFRCHIGKMALDSVHIGVGCFYLGKKDRLLFISQSVRIIAVISFFEICHVRVVEQVYVPCCQSSLSLVDSRHTQNVHRYFKTSTQIHQQTHPREIPLFVTACAQPRSMVTINLWIRTLNVVNDCFLLHERVPRGTSRVALCDIATACFLSVYLFIFHTFCARYSFNFRDWLFLLYLFGIVCNFAMVLFSSE
jgi:hypothetical protein